MKLRFERIPMVPRRALGAFQALGRHEMQRQRLGLPFLEQLGQVETRYLHKALGHNSLSQLGRLVLILLSVGAQ